MKNKFIDTFAITKGRQRPNGAGLQITKEQFEVLAMAAVNITNSTTDHDATEAFERMIDNIIQFHVKSDEMIAHGN